MSHKRDHDDKTASGRPKIGKIGIGFIAANEICERMEIESTKIGSNERLLVEIDFALMRLDIEERARKNQDLAKADFSGTTYQDADPNEHYTRIFLRDVRGEARSILAAAKLGGGDRSLFGLKPESIRRVLEDDRIQFWDEFDSYSKSCLEVALNVPVPYFDHWYPSTHRNKLNWFTDAAQALGFEMIIDGTSWRKPIVLRDDEDGTILKSFSFSGEHVGGHGYFYARSGSLRPRDLNGLLIRIRNAAVGGYDDSFLNLAGYQSALFQDWTSGEFWADDRLEDALNIDRKTLRITHPAYVELQARIHDELRSFLAQVRRELYGRRSRRRKAERATSTIQVLDEITASLTPIIGADSVQRISSAWRTTPRKSTQPKTRGSSVVEPTPAEIRRLTRTYTVNQILEVVRDAASVANLSSRQTAALLEYLTERLLEK
jgi:hypothetical protein